MIRTENLLWTRNDHVIGTGPATVIADRVCSSRHIVKRESLRAGASGWPGESEIEGPLI